MRPPGTDLDRRFPGFGTNIACFLDVRKACVLGALVVAQIAAAGDADAFCRLTTCQPVANCALDERGCPAEGTNLIWKQAKIPWRLHNRGYKGKIKYVALHAAMKSAFDQWQNVICENGEKTSLEFDEQQAAQPNEENAPFSVMWVNAGWEFDESALAQTTHDFGTETGTVKNAIIQMNSTSHTFTIVESSPTALTAAEGADIESVLVHEVGHYIGLAHSEEPGSIMAPSYCQDKDRCETAAASRQLGPDDKLGVCTLFPPPSMKPDLGEDIPTAPSTSFGCAQANVRPHVRRTGIEPVFAMLGVSILVALRRRRR